MNSEGKFWVSIWGIIAVVVCVIVINATNFYAGQEQRTVDMVEFGASPVEAACALQDPVGDSPTCILIVSK